MTLLGPFPATTFRDEHFTFGSTYVYAVRAVAKESGEEAESADSVPVSVTAADAFPPGDPGGLSGNSDPETNQEPAHVELSWSISPETDLAGYWVYRSEDSCIVGAKAEYATVAKPGFP